MKNQIYFKILHGKTLQKTSSFTSLIRITHQRKEKQLVNKGALNVATRGVDISAFI